MGISGIHRFLSDMTPLRSLTLVGGWPSSGKSQFSRNIARIFGHLMASVWAAIDAGSNVVVPFPYMEYFTTPKLFSSLQKSCESKGVVLKTYWLVCSESALKKGYILVA